MQPLIQWIAENRDQTIAGLGIAIVVVVLLQLFLFARLGKLNRLYARLTRNTSGGNLEEILHEYMGTVQETTKRMDLLEKRAESLAVNQKHCIQKLGMVRFDAFEEVGGQQSFALVLLDDEQSGVALSSVYSRQDVRVYAKAIRDGQPSHPLTREEQQALSNADGKK